MFLDEIGDIRPALQAKLLRVLQDQTFERVGGTRPIQTDVRFVAATNRDLRAAVRDGLFRLDLYYRLDVVSVTLPPLRERAGDVPALAQHFLERYRRELKRELHGITPEALSCLRRYAWPGNVRELENVIERAAVLADGPDVTPRDLPAEIREAGLTDGMTPGGGADVSRGRRGVQARADRVHPPPDQREPHAGGAPPRAPADLSRAPDPRPRPGGAGGGHGGPGRCRRPADPRARRGGVTRSDLRRQPPEPSQLVV